MSREASQSQKGATRRRPTVRSEGGSWSRMNWSRRPKARATSTAVTGVSGAACSAARSWTRSAKDSLSSSFGPSPAGSSRRWASRMAARSSGSKDSSPSAIQRPMASFSARLSMPKGSWKLDTSSPRRVGRQGERSSARVAAADPEGLAATLCTQSNSRSADGSQPRKFRCYGGICAPCRPRRLVTVGYNQMPPSVTVVGHRG